VHVPSDVIARKDVAWGESLLGDKTHSKVFDNTRIKALVPGFEATTSFERGAEQIVRWYDADPSRRQIDAGFDGLCDDLVRGIGAL
jgi:nucleoside-diphosphate-sugar epimerase